MMNEREKRDMREYRAYYQNVQKLIIELQQERNHMELIGEANSPERIIAIAMRTMLTLVIKRLEAVSVEE